MLIVTKLDLVKKEERAAVVDYIIKKLNSWNMNIPVFIPYEVETTEERFNDIMGIDKISILDKVVPYGQSLSFHIRPYFSISF